MRAWPLVLALPLAAGGCQLLRRGADDPDAGVPLAAFAAKDGQYFPPYIAQLFPSAAAFAKDNPTLAQARSDVSMIEIRQLNSDDAQTNEANLSWSADGAFLGYEVLAGGFRKIMLKDLNGNAARELEVIPKGASDFLNGMVVKSAQSYNAGLRWSRDSARFAFMSNGGIGEYSIYVGAIGKHGDMKPKPIAKGHDKDGYATWSPSTNEIAFVSARTGRGDIYVVDLASKDLVRLTKDDAVHIFPEWVPDGNHVVFSSGDALVHELVVASRPGREEPWGTPKPLTHWGRDSLRPTVSPDGSYVAFYADDGAYSGSDAHRWNIAVVPLTPGKSWESADLRHMVVAKDVVIDLNTGPAWSPDGRKIFYVKRDPAVFNPIYAYDLFSGRSYLFKTKTRMNRDILMSRLGILSFRAQVGVWDRVFVALTNQGEQLQIGSHLTSKIHYQSM